VRLSANSFLQLPDKTVGVLANYTPVASGARTQMRVPTFVPMLALRRVREKGSVDVLFEASYSLCATSGHELSEMQVEQDPMSLLRVLARLNWSLLLAGWTHERCQQTLRNVIRVPHSWRGARLFVNNFEGLRLAWIMNSIVLVLAMVTVGVTIFWLGDRVRYDLAITVSIAMPFVGTLLNFLFLLATGLGAAGTWFRGLAIRRRHSAGGGRRRANFGRVVRVERSGATSGHDDSRRSAGKGSASLHV